jgi:hypothetical protein
MSVKLSDTIMVRSTSSIDFDGVLSYAERATVYYDTKFESGNYLVINDRKHDKILWYYSPKARELNDISYDERYTDIASTVINEVTNTETIQTIAEKVDYTKINADIERILEERIKNLGIDAELEKLKTSIENKTKENEQDQEEEQETISNNIDYSVDLSLLNAFKHKRR